MLCVRMVQGRRRLIYGGATGVRTDLETFVPESSRWMGFLHILCTSGPFTLLQTSTSSHNYAVCSVHKLKPHLL